MKILSQTVVRNYNNAHNRNITIYQNVWDNGKVNYFAQWNSYRVLKNGDDLGTEIHSSYYYDTLGELMGYPDNAL
jgi:hypothetical protein